MSEIYFIRHAQASFGGENYDRLSDLGKRQAEILGDYLARIQLGFDAVYSGALERQIGTAKTVMSCVSGKDSGREFGIRAEFNEYDSSSVIPSQVEHMIREDPSISEALARIHSDRRAFQQVFGKAVLRWVSGKHDTPGVESWEAFARRVRSGVRKVMNDNGQKKRIAVFTSGGVISAIGQMALRLSDEMAIQLSWELLNTSMSVFKYDETRFGLSSFNSVAHLRLHTDKKLLTYR